MKNVLQQTNNLFRKASCMNQINPTAKNADFMTIVHKIRADCFGSVATVSPAVDRWTFQVPAPQCDEARERNSAN